MQSSKKNFILKSLGCKQNALEGQIMTDDLIKNGYNLVEDIKEADYFILNSCTVTSHADSNASYILKKAKRDNPEIVTILAGCVSQTYKNHIHFDYKIADIVLGNTEKMDISSYLDKNSKDIFEVQDIFEQDNFYNKFLYNPTTTRVSVKIQDGCDNRCSYCIIPYARGKSRSNSIENIIKQIEIINQKGIKEIVLTGIHIGLWGKEFNKNLLDLLKEIEKTNILRYRLGSLYVNEITDEMIDFLKKSKKFCPHFHLSLQSLSDKILNLMNRNYTKDDCINLINKLHKNFDLPYLGCDIIVGFPDENEEDFNQTYQTLKELKLSSIHCFPYSKRENTKAYSMKNQIQDSIKTKRLEKISNLSNELHKEFLEKNQNKKAQVLIQKKDPKTGLYSAITKNYIKIYFKDNNPNLRYNLKNVELKNYKLH